MLETLAVLLTLSEPIYYTAPIQNNSGFGIQIVGCSGCGCRGGPGWRSKKTGRCVSWKKLHKQCGNPPSKKRCTKEN